MKDAEKNCAAIRQISQSQLPGNNSLLMSLNFQIDRSDVLLYYVPKWMNSTVFKQNSLELNLIPFLTEFTFLNKKH